MFESKFRIRGVAGLLVPAVLLAAGCALAAGSPRHRLTRDELLALDARVGEAAPGLLRQGIDVEAYGPGLGRRARGASPLAWNGLENIEVVDLTRHDVKVLDRMFGSGNICVYSIRRSQLPVVTD